MKQGVVLKFVETNKVVLPDSEVQIGLAKDPKQESLFEVVQFNQKLVKDLAHFLYQKDQGMKETLQGRVQGLTQEVATAENYIKVYDEMRVTQEDLLKTIQRRLDYAKSIIDAKEKEQADIKSTLEAKQAETQALKNEVDNLTKNELNALTKEITEAVIKEIHYILSNEPKDPQQISIINSIIILLRNSKAVDHVTVNSYLTHYEGFLQKLIGFTGTKISQEMAEELGAIATKFCEENDESLPHNQGKKINKKYKIYLPLARWTKLATQIALKQATLTHIAGELKKSNTRVAIVSSELAELAEICKEGEKEMALTNEDLADIHKFIANVI